jgi:hypothetical protein
MAVPSKCTAAGGELLAARSSDAPLKSAIVVGGGIANDREEGGCH